MGDLCVQPETGEVFENPNPMTSTPPEARGGAVCESDFTEGGAYAEPSPEADAAREILFDGLYGDGQTPSEREPEPVECEDPMVAARARAEEKLKARLQLTAPGGQSRPDEVSPEQFDKMVQLYAEIDMGTGQIQLDVSDLSEKDQEGRRAAMLEDIAAMMTTGQGRDLLDAMAHERNQNGELKTTTIKAISDARQAHSTGAHGDPDENPLATNGKGDDAIIYYGPGEDFVPMGKVPEAPYLPVSSDITLFHEMVHAYHVREGDIATGSTREGNHEVGNWERQAVGLGEEYEQGRFTESQYRAELRENGRGDAPERPEYQPDP